MHISLLNKYFYKNKQSKLYFEDHVAVLNVIYFLYGRSIFLVSDYTYFWEQDKARRVALYATARPYSIMCSHI